MCDISLSLIAPWEKLCRQCLREISLPELGDDPTNHPALAMREFASIKKSCAIANRTKKKRTVLMLKHNDNLENAACTAQRVGMLFKGIVLVFYYLKDNIQIARDNKQSLCQVREVINGNVYKTRHCIKGALALAFRSRPFLRS